MKGKKLCVLLAAVLAASLCGGCGDKKEEPAKENEMKFASFYQGEQVSVAAGDSYMYTFSADLEDRNYLRMDISATATFRGVVHYAHEEFGNVTEDSESAEEEFFTLAGQNMRVCQILDFYNYFPGNRTVRGIEFFNLSDAAGAVTLAKVEAAKHFIDFTAVSFNDTQNVEPQLQLYLQGKSVKLGCTLKSGGAVNWLSSTDNTVRQINREDGTVYVGKFAPAGTVVKDNDVNLVNAHDNGRLVQQSYYGIAPDNDQGYEPGEYGAVGDKRPWHYNPVQGGNYANEFSQLVDVAVSDNEIYIKARPRDWAKAHEFSTSYMENWYSLQTDPVYGEYIRVKNRFTDFSGYDHNNPRAQEIPAFYGIASLGKFVYYGGDTPFANDTLSERADLAFWDGNKDCRFRLTENWSAWVNDENWGIGLYVPDAVSALAGRTAGFTLDAPADDRPDKAASSTYTAPLGNFSMVTYEPFEYTYFLTLDTVENARDLFEKLHEQGVANEFLQGKEVPNWVA